jgi:HEPN domain-containing protein
MNGVLKEWIDKAEGDLIVALREYRARKAPNHDAACFHAQQCVEKYLKAVLMNERIPIRRTHDLVSLLQECLPNHPLWDAMRPDLERLSQSAVKVRYPGESATREQASRAIAMARRCRAEIRLALNLPSEQRRGTRRKK